MMKAAWIVGIDIGGTFTDVVAVNASSGEARTAKVRSRPADPLQSVESAFEAVAVGWSDVSNLIYGTTMATNAIVEGNLAPVALVATEGFRDTIEIGRQNRRELYRLEVPPKLPPLVPEERRLEVAERVDAPNGSTRKARCCVSSPMRKSIGSPTKWPRSESRRLPWHSNTATPIPSTRVASASAWRRLLPTSCARIASTRNPASTSAPTPRFSTRP